MAHFWPSCDGEEVKEEAGSRLDTHSPNILFNDLTLLSGTHELGWSRSVKLHLLSIHHLHPPMIHRKLLHTWSCSSSTSSSWDGRVEKEEDMGMCIIIPPECVCLIVIIHSFEVHQICLRGETSSSSSLLFCLPNLADCNLQMHLFSSFSANLLVNYTVT